MTERFGRPGTFARPPDPGRQPVITVVVLGDEFSGAMAYALDCALFMPASVRAVRVRPRSRLERPCPIPVDDLSGVPSASLAKVSACSDRMVVQSGGRDVDPTLLDLRRQTSSPVVEVDGNGVVMRVSDPRGWSMPAVGRHAG
ncbi:hypothetical protein GEV29_13175 [Aeromicrobium sp. SMF47]|uniref:Uncharacterized protein n=1 Tax=Aeromicrobium yanjiei TaxID=2662028 RepID=A0A5Q2MFI5_9ACTN|nr:MULTISPECIES: hypothetical protein [Aeromicrobium]MRJ77493.1 hypothetical protein [Aeromicrobium yanjiei]MRK01860.1 hypothetical protein [Aeromicrobium sp. S22]QGG41398.1 hypothetical protein GEV26_08510 [Aeromicrobium yanjiei]